MEMSMSKCAECGLMHPPVARGTCPIAREAKLKEQVALDKKGILKEAILAVQEEMVSKLKGKDKETVDKIVANIIVIVNK
jgi:hypothetical protein